MESFLRSAETLRLQFHFSRHCRLCDKQITDEPEPSYLYKNRASHDPEGWEFWGDPYLGYERGRQKLSLFQCCKTCAEHDAELHAALDEKRRVTRIYVQRCICGASKLWSLDSCIKCSQRNRMLSKLEAEQKLFAKVLTQLRKEIKSKSELIGA